MAEVTSIYARNREEPEPLWREMLGSRLRALRNERDETLAGTAERAGISPQYLSEVERGRKEPSSEMIAALAGALGTTLADLTLAVAEDLRRRSGTGSPLSGTGRFTRAAGPQAPATGPFAPAPSVAPAPPVALAMAA
jgi:transcriptional regulator with XRE-family HTH domain